MGQVQGREKQIKVVILLSPYIYIYIYSHRDLTIRNPRRSVQESAFFSRIDVINATAAVSRVLIIYCVTGVFFSFIRGYTS